MTKPDHPDAPARASSWKDRLAAIAACVAVVAALVGNIDKISETAKKWFGGEKPKPQPTIIVQITRETLLQAATEAQAVARLNRDDSGEAAAQQADNLKRAADNIRSPIELSGGVGSPAPKWLTVALREQGQTEVVGSENNPRIIQYLESVSPSLSQGGDETPWNAAFVNWVFKQSGIEPRGSALAREWLSWGQELATPRLGALAVFSRRGSEHMGSLCFYLGEIEGQVLCLGGNFYNSVQLSAKAKASLLAYRWPNVVQQGAPADHPASASLRREGG